jgi:hypothetical protein
VAFEREYAPSHIHHILNLLVVDLDGTPLEEDCTHGPHRLLGVGPSSKENSMIGSLGGVADALLTRGRASARNDESQQRRDSGPEKVPPTMTTYHRRLMNELHSILNMQ